MRSAPLLLLLAAVPASAAERRFPVADFERVQVDGPFTVSIRTGRGTSVTATGPAGALGGVQVESTSGTLRIRRVASAGSAVIRLEVGTRTLRGVRVSGAGRVGVERVVAASLDLALAGDGLLYLPNVAVDRLRVLQSGGGRVQIGGRAEEARIEAQGTGQLDARALQVEQATLATSTIGTVVVGVTERATVTAAGLGDVRVIGTTNCTIRGAAADQVRCTRLDEGETR